MSDEEDRAARRDALALAVDTVKTVHNFTNFQVVHTAKLYADFIIEGLVPPTRQVVTDADADVLPELPPELFNGMGPKPDA